jgi:hypothetical protein
MRHSVDRYPCRGRRNRKLILMKASRPLPRRDSYPHLLRDGKRPTLRPRKAAA